jgi:uncharacterized protein YqkB
MLAIISADIGPALYQNYTIFFLKNTKMTSESNMADKKLMLAIISADFGPALYQNYTKNC